MFTSENSVWSERLLGPMYRYTKYWVYNPLFPNIQICHFFADIPFEKNSTKKCKKQNKQKTEEAEDTQFNIVHVSCVKLRSVLRWKCRNKMSNNCQVLKPHHRLTHWVGNAINSSSKHYIFLSRWKLQMPSKLSLKLFTEQISFWFYSMNWLTVNH